MNGIHIQTLKKLGFYNTMAESKVIQLTKEVEDLKRKLREINHDKVIAINRCNGEWESKLVHQTNMLERRKDISKQQELSSLELEVKLQKEKEFSERMAQKNLEIKKLKEQLGYDKDNAVTRTEVKIEDKWETRITKLQDQWKEKEIVHLQKISVLQNDKDALTKSLRELRDVEFETRQEINHMRQEHQSERNRIMDMSRRTFNDSTRELKKMDDLLKDKEDETAQLTRKVDLVELDKELMEKELLIYKKRIHGHDASIKSAGINFSLTHKDLTKKIASLEGKIRQLQIENDQLSTDIRPDSQMGHVSVGQDDKIRRLRRQREELRDIVTRMEEKNNELENRCNMLEEDHTAYVRQLEITRNENENMLCRLAELKQECDNLRHDNIDLQESIRDFPVDDYEQTGMIQNQTALIMELERDRDDYVKEVKELNEQKEGLMIRCEKLKNDYQSAKDQTTRLLEEREDIKTQEGQQEKQIARLRERTVRLEQNQERWQNKIGEQREEIERLQNMEQRAMQADAYKRQLDELRRQY